MPKESPIPIKILFLCLNTCLNFFNFMEACTRQDYLILEFLVNFSDNLFSLDKIIGCLTLFRNRNFVSTLCTH